MDEQETMEKIQIKTEQASDKKRERRRSF